MKGIFDTKPSSVYDDDPTRHYQFPRRYAANVRNCEGDWIVLRRPRAEGGNSSYFGAALVERVDVDFAVNGMGYAHLKGYIGFDSAVPWQVDGRYWEEALRLLPRRGVGPYLRGRSVRTLSDEDFADIIVTGLKETFDPSIAEKLGLTREPFEEVELLVQRAVEGEQQARVRAVERALASRVVRDAKFRRTVGLAYGFRCAATGLRIRDWGGRAEAQTAHIWPVTEGGPDIVQNGIALSATVHWLFDRHLISLTDDCRLLMRKERIPPALRSLLVEEGEKVWLPEDRSSWPGPQYIGIHRRAYLEKNDQGK